MSNEAKENNAMTNHEKAAISNRYEFVLLYDVKNGNPNGDPSNGNMPRQHADTGYGYATDACIKRKIRNYIDVVKNGEKGFAILYKPDRALNAKFRDAYEENGLPLDKTKKGTSEEYENIGKKYMCNNYYDVRTFGAPMTTGTNSCGIVTGPVQINFPESVSPIFPEEITITRQARTTEERMQTGDTELGTKQIIPYGLYRVEGYVSAMYAQKTGFTEEDLECLWEALENMFDLDHSASRGKVCFRGLYIFRHDSALGNAHSDDLFSKIQVKEKEGVKTPASFKDYEVTVDKNMPEGVTLIVR